MSSKITNLTTIWPSFFSGLDLKNGLSWEKHLWNGLIGKISVWNSKSWFLQIIDQNFGQRWSFFRLLKIIMNYFWVLWVFFDYYESWRFASRGALPPLDPPLLRRALAAHAAEGGMTRLRVLSILTGFCSTLELVYRVVPGFCPTLTFELIHNGQTHSCY